VVVSAAVVATAIEKLEFRSGPPMMVMPLTALDPVTATVSPSANLTPSLLNRNTPAPFRCGRAVRRRRCRRGHATAATETI
jgi:hypothetical protein